MELEKILKEQGYTDEQIKALLDAMAAGKLYVSAVEKPEDTIRQLQEAKTKLEQENAKLQQGIESQAQASGKGEETAAEIRKLQETVQKAQVNLQLVKALTKANAADVDYMIYQAERSGRMKDVKLNDDGSISGVDELVEGLKKDFAAQFTARQDNAQGLVRTGIKKLDGQAADNDTPQTLEEAIAQKLSAEEA